MANAQDYLVYTEQPFPETDIVRQTAFIKAHIPETNLEQISFKLRFFNKSLYSKHFTFDIYYDSLMVYRNFVKVNTDIQNKVISIAPGLSDFSQFLPQEISWKKTQWQTTSWPTKENVKKEYLAIFDFQEQVQLVKVQDDWNADYDRTKVWNLQGALLAEWNHVRNLGIDTFVNAYVFEPDPLTFLSRIYGSPYVDSNDQDLSWMNAAYLPVNIPAIYDTFTNRFYLENDYVKMSDLAPPLNPPVSDTGNNFYFNRSEIGFEQCMAAYHITQFHDHLTNLGYDTLMDLQLEIDALSNSGADNSTFNRNGGNPNARFGSGGIDDAEDADVIIHEYAHGVSWSANDNLLTHFERLALDEGIADYFATSYSRSLSNFGWQKVFNWDGNNGNWQGRSAVSTTNYSNPFNGNIYALGEVWNTAMQYIYNDLGRNTTDALMLEILFFLTDSTNLPSAAFYMLQADQLLFGGANKATLCQHFKSKNLLSWDCYPTLLNDAAEKTTIKLINSFGFALGTANATIQFPKHQYAKIELFDINGRCILREYIHQNSFDIVPANYSAGLYILKIQTEEGTQTFKLLRN